MNIYKIRPFFNGLYIRQSTCLLESFQTLRCKSSDQIFSRDTHPEDYDLVGPQDSKSNIRKMIFSKKSYETRREQELRLQKQALQSWHQEFWTKHNKNFNESKKKFLAERRKNEDESDKQFADDLSVFYKDFLDKNFNLHKDYLWEWYKRNFKLVWPSFLISFQQCKNRLLRRK
ncbi:COA8 family protein CBG23705, mitochondrial-like [Actinia tenebrosa]|uniref:COA8 family protein CBG23705, mitochondrial-like n=1 Tax=Actinia tenebrosa TaxID=6105 RepID=A0A6P8HX58_ACTTE|nr:COA8 family protein CBG23705, mitochondrial-like [Actinia tenebrosa]